jgi:tripartite-type tricarboxylate transporter receptor subunit TctC
MNDLMGQVIDFAFLPVAGPFPGFVDKGSVKMLGISGTKPSPKFPNSPLIKNTTGFHDFVFTAWAGIHVSNKVPDDVVALLNKAAIVALETSYVQAQIAASGSERFELWNAKQAHDYYIREVSAFRTIGKSIDLKVQQ